MKRLEDVLADARGDAQVLRRHGQHAMADAQERLADAVREAMEDYLTWMSEDDAILQSDRARAWFRSRFADWATMECAELRNGRRYYRAMIVPRRANRSAALEAGRRAAQQAEGAR